MNKSEYAPLYADISEKLKIMQLYKVAKETGLSYGTLKNIKNGVANPSMRTIENLRGYFNQKFSN